MSYRLLIILTVCFISITSEASNNFGLGLIIGSPTGISGKYLMSQRNAIDGALAWSLGDNNNLHIHGDYLWHTFDIFRDGGAPIDLFYGVGLRLVAKDESLFGPRFPIGLRHMFRDPRIEVFVEVALILNLIEKTDLDADIGIGGRYYF